MHRLKDRTYVGAPGETVSLTKTVDGGGQVRTSLDGAPLTSDGFPLSGSPGSQARLEVMLVGPLGASCVLGIAEVDGSQDGDLLLCQPFDPAPVQFYLFSVASSAAVGALSAMRGLRAVRTAAPMEAAGARAKRPRTRAAKRPGARRKKRARKHGKGR